MLLAVHGITCLFVVLNLMANRGKMGRSHLIQNITSNVSLPCYVSNEIFKITDENECPKTFIVVFSPSAVAYIIL